MVYGGTYTSETIVIKAEGQMQYIELMKSANEPTFSVSCGCDEDWGYEFIMEDNSSYERVKITIMETIFECESMEEVLSTLSEIFENGFADILIDNGCNGDCEHCENKYLN